MKPIRALSALNFISPKNCLKVSRNLICRELHTQYSMTNFPTVDSLSDIDFSKYLGEEIEIGDRRFVVDHINDLFGTVELRYVTFQDNTGFPMFRSEKLEWLQYVMETRDTQEPDVPDNEIKVFLNKR